MVLYLRGVLCVLFGGIVCSAAASGGGVVPSGGSIDLSGKWLFKYDDVRPDGTASDFGKLYAKSGELTEGQIRDRRGYGFSMGYAKAEFDDSGWGVISVPGGWGKQGYKQKNGLPYHGPAWYRRRVKVPAEWSGVPLLLELGQPTQRGTAYWNGEQVCDIPQWGPHFIVIIPPEKVRFGHENTIAVMVSNHYKEGGITEGPVRMSKYSGSQAGISSRKPGETLELSLDRDLSSDVIDGVRWMYGWRDEGTSDTRPLMSRADGAYNGRDAIRMNVWYPNSTEFVDFKLGKDENGRVWREKGMDYISFMVKSDVDGEMQMRLNHGDVRWRKSGFSASARFYVKSGGWARVVIPFEKFYSKEEPLSDTSQIDTIALGYGNNELQGKGNVLFADFRAGAYANPTAFNPADLSGVWRFKTDNFRPDGEKSVFSAGSPDKNGYGIDLGYNTPGFDDSDWALLRVGKSWEKQGYQYDGPAWFRRKVVIPAEWKGCDLELRLGRPDDRGTVYWNGKAVQTIEKFGPDFKCDIPAGEVLAGAENTIAVQVFDWYKDGGIIGSPFLIRPKPGIVGFRSGGKFVPAEEFDPGPLPPDGGTYSVVLRVPSAMAAGRKLRANFQITDCFYNLISDAVLPLSAAGDGQLEAEVVLSGRQAEKLYFGEWLDVECVVTDSGAVPVTGFYKRRLKLKYESRDEYALPELPETYEETPFGRLRLVDVVDASAAPSECGHPYKEGGVRDFWGGRRAYSPWKEGISVKEFLGRKYREAADSRHFGYRVGRGKMKPGTQYLLRILYPEDKPRYFAMDIKAGRNYQGVGFFSGVSPDDPGAPYPLSGKYEWCDHVVSLDDVTYGYRGKRSVSSENGFWVFFHDIGRVYSPQYGVGPAVAEIRLYEIPDPASHYPAIRLPEGMPKRILMMDWERQPEANPDDICVYARLTGINAIGPLFLKWAFNGYFPNDMDYKGAPEWFGTPVHRDGFGDENCHRIAKLWLDAALTNGVTIIPRIEYGGSPKLPPEARVIGRNGKPDPCGRYVSWGANLLHPSTLEDFKATLDQSIGRYAGYPNLGGFLWRMRSDRMKCSYGLKDIEMFCSETGRSLPVKNAAKAAEWASKNEAAAYDGWWQLKKRDFLVAVRDIVRSYRPDMKLYYYNWDPDGWDLRPSANAGNTAKDWSESYNVNTAPSVYRCKTAAIKNMSQQDWLDVYLGGKTQLVNEPHKLMRMEPYRDVDGIAVFAPVHWDYLADNEPYINYFRTGDGLAVCNQFRYEEKARQNVQGDNYETSEMTPGGPDFAMAVEVLSFFHGDPNVITWTPYTVGRSFVTEHRRFARAFLALPAVQGMIVENAVSGDAAENVRVRTYPGTGGASYVSVCHKGYGKASFRVCVPADSGAVSVTDLVSGEAVPFEEKDGMISFNVDSGAMQLNSYKIAR